MVASLGSDVKPLALSPSGPCTPVGIEADVKEPVTLFEKIRRRRPRCLSDLCRHWSGWARCDQNMN